MEFANQKLSEKQRGDQGKETSNDRSSLPQVYIGKREIAEKVAELAKAIDKDYQNKNNLVILCVMNGSFIFTSDLTRQISGDFQLDFIEISSYGNNTTSSGKCKIVRNSSLDIAGRDVLIIEDIIDTGNTLDFLFQALKSEGAKQIEIAALLAKHKNRALVKKVRYLGFEIEDKFVVGYGLDYGGRFRQLPYIGILG